MKGLCKLWPFTLFLLFFFAVPISQLKPDLKFSLKMMPGDFQDARLNNYFLENIYLFLSGKSDSLWHPGFFWPFPFILGFSDNLLGSSPVYILARLLTGQPDTAYQIWFLFGYIVNFWASYYALKKIGISCFSASIGAVIFTFALPTTAHQLHSQLHYRFGVPLSLSYFVFFLDRKRLEFLIVSLFWLVWQFYCGIYIGFFSLLLNGATTVAYIFHQYNNPRINFVLDLQKGFKEDWACIQIKRKIVLILGTITLFGMLLLLFYPYLQVSKLYGFKRFWSEISTMLPRPQSYLIADYSWFWSHPSAKLFSEIPMRHEHQMFPGVISLLLFLCGAVYSDKIKNTTLPLTLIMSGALGILVILTLYIGGFSLWFFFHWLPLASAIRAMTRIDLVMLLPLAIVSACFLDKLREKWRFGKRFIVIVILPALLIELSASSMPTSPKTEWRERLKSKLSQIPQNLNQDSVLFIAAPESDGWWYKPELDAMWIALKLGKKTMNGYSGNNPSQNGYGFQYGVDCSILPQRIMSYLDFAESRLLAKPSYQSLMSKVVPVGFVGCDPLWWSSPPQISTSDRVYSKEEFSKLSLKNAQVEKINDYSILKFDIINNSGENFSAKSGINKPIRISWRYLNNNCSPTTDWDTRKDIPFDIPSNGKLPMIITLDRSKLGDSCGIEISIVQEFVFWGHDIGIEPLLVKWKND